MKKIKLKSVTKILKYFIWLSILIMPLILLDIRKDLKNKDNSARWLFQNTSWNRMSKIEGEYVSFMYDVIDQFSSKFSRHSMTKEMRIKYVAENFRLARAFGFGYFNVPTIHILESDLDPNKKHDLYKEVGMGGFWYGTAKYYFYLAKEIMPKRLWHYVRFDLTKPTDLNDPINALRMTYIFLWLESYNYDGIEMWYISAYRWGRFVGQHWQDGLKEFPVKFVIYTKYGKKQYNPRAYYWTWKHITSALERGDIDVAKDIYKKYKRKGDKLKYEEIEYRRAVRVIKNLRKQIKQERDAKDFYIREMKQTDEIARKAKNTMRSVGRVAKKEGWTKEHIKSFVSLCRKIWNKLKEKNKNQ